MAPPADSPDPDDACAAAADTSWFVYIVRCADDTLYTGVALDPERRLAEHNGDERGGARYTRARRPVELIYTEPAESRSAAQRREVQLKRLSRAAKLRLVGVPSRDNSSATHRRKGRSPN